MVDVAVVNKAAVILQGLGGRNTYQLKAGTD